MSPTAPTIVTLNDQLNKAHRRIRELQARETELLAENRTLCAAITHNVIDASARRPTIGIDTRRAGDPVLSLLALQRWESDGGAVPPQASQAQQRNA